MDFPVRYVKSSDGSYKYTEDPHGFFHHNQPPRGTP